jgi:hypothetical protein
VKNFKKNKKNDKKSVDLDEGTVILTSVSFEINQEIQRS